MDASRVQEYFRVGVPVWFIRPESTITTRTKIFKVVDRTPCRMLSADIMEADFNGPLQGVATSQPKSLRSLSIFDAEEDVEELSRVKAAFLMEWTKRDDQHPHYTEQRPTKPLPRRAERRTLQVQAVHAIAGSIARSQFYCVPVSIDGKPDLPPHHSVIQDVLKNLGTVHKSQDYAAVYFYPPPFILVHKDKARTARNYHCYLHIRSFLRKNLWTESQFMKRSRKVQTWQDIIHGNFGNNPPIATNMSKRSLSTLYDTLTPSVDTKAIVDKRDEETTFLGKKRRRVEKAAMKATFAAEGDLSSYTSDLRPRWRNREISIEIILADRLLREEIQWEINELNFRMELWALDAAISSPYVTLSESDRHKHYSNLCCVYNGSSGGVGKYSLLPNMDDQISPYISERHISFSMLAAFQSVLRQWSGCPKEIDLMNLKERPPHDALRLMLNFYVEKFVLHYKRVPCLPCCVPHSLSF